MRFCALVLALASLASCSAGAVGASCSRHSDCRIGLYCSPLGLCEVPPVDAAVDAVGDGGHDGGADATLDGGADATEDGGADASADGGADASVDGAVDAGVDAP